MRHLIIRVPQGCGAEVVEIARSHDAANLVMFGGQGDAGPVDLVMFDVSNDRVEPVLGELDSFRELHLTLLPAGVLALRPPADEAPEQVREVTPRSPVEVFLGGLQSVGSWKGFLGYAAVAGVVVWIGLFTNAIFLLTAAMLIAPFAGPAMNAALATARGDAWLFWHSLARYAAALSVSITVAWIMSMVMDQQIATPLMIETSLISSTAVLLPLVAGAAGALNLCQSERSSLVSGAATGVLVAASLAPPAGLVGMAASLGEWGMAKAGAFLLMLQVVGINVSGAIVFRLYGLSPRGPRYDRGKGWIGYASWAASAICLAGLVFWQLSDSPSLQQSTRAQRAAAAVQDLIQASESADPVIVETRFTRAGINGEQTLLIEVFVQRKGPAPAEQIRSELAADIKARIGSEFDVVPLVDITVLDL